MPSGFWRSIVPGLLAHVPVTLLYAAVPVAASLLLGTLLCMVRTGRRTPLYWVVTVVISFFRGTPGIVQLYLVFFGLPRLGSLLGADLDGWPAGAFYMIAATLNLSCFTCEALRGGYLGVDRGQIEAGRGIGFSRAQNLVHVIAPQTLRTALPNLKNLAIDVLKDTSIAYVIGAVELLGYARTVVAARYGIGQLWILGAAAALYFILCALVELAFDLASRRIARHEGSPS